MVKVVKYMEFVDICLKEVVYDLNRGLRKTIKYSLCECCEKGKKFYSVRISSNYNGVNKYSTAHKISNNITFTKNLIYYLSENGIDDITFKDILTDLNIKSIE